MDSKIPEVGQIVHYFPNGADPVAAANYANMLPAIVVQSFGPTCANLQVFTMNHDAHTVLRFSVQHNSLVTGEGQACWAYTDRELIS